MKNEKKYLGIISLGCDKNRVDSEKLLALVKDDYEITSDIEKAQIIAAQLGRQPSDLHEYPSYQKLFR